MSLVTNFEPFQSAKAQADLSATLWARLRQEAEEAFARERALAPIFVNSILNRPTFEDAVIHRISARLGNEIVPAYLVNDVFGHISSMMCLAKRSPATRRLASVSGPTYSRC
jgi:serine O-acetyltransferase